MSAEDLALFLRKKMGEQRATNAEMVRRTKISRRTWYRLLSADIEEAKLSTLVKLTNALNVDITELIKIYFSDSSLNAKPCIRNPVETNLASNSLVSAGQLFLKKWEVKNLSRERWTGLRLRCVDEKLDIKILDEAGSGSIPAPSLQAQCSEVIIPDTRCAEIAKISMNFVAPDQLGTTVSHWRFFKDDQLLEEAGYPKLDCLVKVVDSAL